VNNEPPTDDKKKNAFCKVHTRLSFLSVSYLYIIEG